MATQREISGAIKDVNAGSGTSTLGRLSDLHDFKVAEGYPDIRGWNVQLLDGGTVGKVDDLIVDTSAMRVRYLNVKLDRSVVRDTKDAGLDPDGRHTLLPIGVVALDERDDHVLVNGYTVDQIALLPVYDGQVITGAYETSIRTALIGGGAPVKGVAAAGMVGGAAVDAQSMSQGLTQSATQSTTQSTAQTTGYDHPHYDEQRLYAARRKPAAAAAADVAGTQRITLAEEQLSVGKRQVAAGEVDVRKTVDTRHVQEQVATTRDEVTVERRPITDASQLDVSPIGEGEIRIPVMEEQLVVEKRMVPIEQIIVRKNVVTEQQTVQGDVRRERLEIDDTTARAAGAVRDTGTSGAKGSTRPNSDR